MRSIKRTVSFVQYKILRFNIRNNFYRLSRLLLTKLSCYARTRNLLIRAGCASVWRTFWWMLSNTGWSISRHGVFVAVWLKNRWRFVFYSSIIEVQIRGTRWFTVQVGYIIIGCVLFGVVFIPCQMILNGCCDHLMWRDSGETWGTVYIYCFDSI
jgi:hypothetical protein